ncbi:MAG: aminoacyl-tRNA hydrolase [Bacteroidetes bacterium]|nr:aminoacyl-tRNA hydrolase [Bacteroidota bacterium]
MRYLVAGLGNVGSEYAGTRHNIGFDVVDYLARKHEVAFASDRLADVAEIKYRGRFLRLIKPSTYMNRSGRAIKYWMEQDKISADRLLVIVDDLNLPLGKLRMRTKGSDGGHNGLADIQAVFGHTNYARLRVGIGSEFSKGAQVDFVLGRWSSEESKALVERIPLAAEAALRFSAQTAGQVMEWANAQ